MSVASSSAYFVLLGLCCWTDVRSGRLPNAITMSGLVVALALRAVAGLDPLAGGFAGAGIAFLVSLPLFLLGGFGGGDVKMLVAVGAFLGPGRLVTALLIMALAGGVLAIFQALRNRAVLGVLLNSGALLKRWATLGRGGYAPALEAPGALTVPYGLAIAIGGLAGWAFDPVVL